MSATMTISDLAEVLFASTLQESDQPSPARIRTAISARLRTRGDVRADSLACVAKEAGDHPEAYAARMHWALDAVARAYSPTPTALAAT